MTAARRARLGVLRCEDKARRAEFRADRYGAGTALADGYADLAATYRQTADEWRKVLADLDAPADAACDECGRAAGEECSDECDCPDCRADRAADADHDAWADR